MTRAKEQAANVVYRQTTREAYSLPSIKIILKKKKMSIGNMKVFPRDQ